jgi:y4mF family transcriptional regulator
MNEYSNLANFVKYYRRELNLTQEELAERAGVGLRFVRDLEQGKETLRMDKVNQVLALFGHRVAAASEKVLDPHNILWAHFNRNVEITLKNKTTRTGFLVGKKLDGGEIVGWRFVSNNNAVRFKKTGDSSLLEDIENRDIDSISNI